MIKNKKALPRRICPINITLSVIGGKWKPIILSFLLKNGTLRFGEFQKNMPRISQKTLTLQLRELENHGVIHRKVYQEVPPKVEYSLTEYGETLTDILYAMRTWGNSHMQKNIDIEK